MKFLAHIAFAVFFVVVGQVFVLPVMAQTQDDFLLFRREAETETRVTHISVEGTERVDPATVVSYLTIKPGDSYTQSQLSNSLRNLYSTGLFADANIRQDGGNLIVFVVENPVINRVAFEGNKRIEDADLASEIKSRPRSVYVRSDVRRDVERIQDIYRRSGRYSIEVSPRIIRLDQNRIDLVFEITEGPVSEIKGIKFIGNKVFDDDTLRSEISSKETRWYRFLSTDDRYDPDRLAYDQELLRRFYLRNGYADFRVLSAMAELSPDREGFYVTIMVEEGDRYKINNVVVNTSQLRNVDSKVFQDIVTFKKGDWYSSREVEKTVDLLADQLGDMQYAFAKIQPAIDRSPETKTVNVTFTAQETQRVFVERIEIKGNVRTLDKVIRREMDLMEGDPFSSSKLAKSEREIRNLNFFNDVKVKPVAGSAPDQTVVEIDVEEKSTGEISVGAGFSTTDGPLADLRIRERNLLGKGQDLLFATTLAGERTQFDVSFTEPYFLDRDLSAGIDAFHITRDLQDESSYDQKSSGFALRTEYPFSDKLRQQLRYRIQKNEISNVAASASIFVKGQEGERTTSAVSQTLTYVDLDSNLFPTNGHKMWLETEIAGLGGDARFLSAKTGAAFYYPVIENVTLSLLGEIGAIEGYGDRTVRINERYFIGSRTLRGFEYAGLGPRDTATGDALGGNKFYRGSVELGFPIGLPEEMGIKGHLFSDFGSLWDLDGKGTGVVDEGSIRASVGFGLSWRSPMGPLRVDFAAPIFKEDYDKKEVFRFDFGTRF